MDAMSSNLTELILDRAHNAAVLMDEHGLVTYWNPSAERMFELTREQAVGRTVAELIIPEPVRGAHLAGLRRFVAEGVGPVLDQRIEVVALKGDGSEFPVEMTISAHRDTDERWFFHAFIQDISERRQAERERERLVEELRATLRGSERRFDAIVGSLSDPVTIRDREHRFVYANQAALVHLGFDSWEELRETAPAQIMSDYVVLGEDGGEVAMQDIPSVRLLRGEAAEPLLIQTINRDSGAQRWNLLKAAPLLDEHGEVEATITIIEDLTERKRAELRSEFLAEASAALASSLDYEQTLRNVAELAVPGIADWCAVDLLDENGDRRTVAVAHVDREMLSLAETLRSYVPDRVNPDGGFGRVLHTGEAVIYPEITDEMLANAAIDDRHLELLRALRFRSVLIVPMRLGERILGAMTLVSAESIRALDEFDRDLAEQVASRAAVAIENSRLYSERSSIARTLQQSLLPEQLPSIPGYELASIYLPAVEASMVGGDFYDVWEVRGIWMIVIGDVTGKGIEAAALTALVRHTLRTASEFHSSPAELLAFVDATLKKRPTLSVCTALCMRLERENLTLSVGGHPLPLHISDRRIDELGEHGPLLGAFPGARWRDFSLQLQADSAVVAYTDGITDAQGEGRGRFGLARLSETLGRLSERPLAEVVDGLTRELESFQAGTHTDDTAAIALRRLSERAAAQAPLQTHAVLRAGTITTPA
jgi:PAS domain S-box-containing protein